jgi:hypothetical protein
MMCEKQSTSNLGAQITSQELVRSALDDKVKAISGYEEIIWKIRSGYVVILYGALTLLLGKEGISDMDLLHSSLRCIVFLILGLSLSVFLIDFGYVRKKLKIVAAREKLIEHAFGKNFNSDDRMLESLLRIAGETPPEHLAPTVREDYKAKRNWNLRWILTPIYATTPVLASIAFWLTN